MNQDKSNSKIDDLIKFLQSYNLPSTAIDICTMHAQCIQAASQSEGLTQYQHIIDTYFHGIKEDEPCSPNETITANQSHAVKANNHE